MSNVKVNIPKGWLKRNQKVKKKIDKAMKEAAKETAASMLKVIQSRKDPATGRLYKPLAKSTIEQRKRLSKYNKTHKEYSHKRSNLTITGKFLDSFFSKVKTVKGAVTLSILTKGNHKGYKGVNGKRGKSVPNVKILEGQQAMGRDPLTVTEKRLENIKKLMKRLLRKNLR